MGRSYTKRLVFYLAALNFFGLLSFLVFPNLIPANSVAEAGVYSTPTISISASGGGSPTALTLIPTHFDSSAQTISVSTTNYTGYTLSFKADGDSAALASNQNNVIPTVSGSVTSSTISNAYGHKISLNETYKIGGSDTYLPVPHETAEIVDTTEVANSSTANEYTLTFGIKVDETIPVALYSKTYTATAIANDAVIYSINFNSNTQASTTNMPSNIVSASVDSTDLTIVFSEESLPEREHYEFLGWDESSSATTPTYEPGDSFTKTLDADIENTFTLYAVWKDITCPANSICYEDSGATMGTMGTYRVQAAESHKTLTPDSDVCYDEESCYGLAEYTIMDWEEPYGLDFDGDGIDDQGYMEVSGDPYGLSSDPMYTLSECESMLATYGWEYCVEDIIYDSNIGSYRYAWGRWQNDGQDNYTFEPYYADFNNDGVDEYMWKAGGYTYNECMAFVANYTDSPYYYGIDSVGVCIITGSAWEGPQIDYWAIQWESPAWADYSLKGVQYRVAAVKAAYNAGICSSVGGVYTLPGSNSMILDQPIDYYYCYNANGEDITDQVFFQDINMCDKYAFDEIYDNYGNSAGFGIVTSCKDYNNNDLMNRALTGVVGSTPSVYYAKLIAPNLRREGYGLAGWNTKKDGSGTSYGPNEIVRLSNDLSTYGLNLFPHWIKKDSNDTLQSFSSSGRCSTMDVGDVLALEDERDGEVYTVAKLVDGKCWMSENLRFTPTDLKENVTINSSNTNHPTTGFISAANSLASNFDGHISCQGIGSGATCTDRIAYYEKNKTGVGTAAYTGVDQSASTYWLSYGVLYNYYTATAGNATYNTISSTTRTLEGDICPAGWHMPTGDGTYGTEFKQLQINYYGDNYDTIMQYNDPENYGYGDGFNNYKFDENWLKYPNNYVLSGHLTLNSSVSRYDKTSFSSYRSSSVNNSASSSNGLSIYHSVGIGNTDYDIPYAYNGNPDKSYGSAVRCVMGTKYHLTYDGNGAPDGSMPDIVRNYNITGPGFRIYLSAPNYKYDDHSFLGWSFNKNATSADYGPEEYITITDSMITNYAGNDGALTLYAIWKEKESDVTMQTFDPEDYKNEEVGFTLALRDERDDNVYTVAKLADGKFWMTDNLRLNFASAGLDENNKYIVGALNSKDGTTVTALNNNNTNNPSETFLKQTTEPASANSFGYTNNVLKFNTSNLTALTSTATTNIPRYYYGTYYNYYSATAGTLLTTDVPSASGNMEINATGDICPKGWRLPKGDYFSGLETNNDFYVLGSSIMGDQGGSNYVRNKFIKYPLNFVFSGSTSERGIDQSYSTSNASATYLTSTMYKSGSYYYRRMSYSNRKDLSSTIPRDRVGYYSYSNVYIGGSVRCVAGKQYRIVYDGNGADGAMPSSDTAASFIPGNTFMLSAPNYKYDDHSFLGWSFNKNATSADYGPEEYITITDSMITNYAGNDGALTLYAIWKEKESDVTMQTFDPEDYKNEEVGFTLALRDERDDNVYTVAKLADGKFWMTDNLRLNFASAGLDENNKYIVGALNSKDGTTVTALNNNNTNNPSETFLKQTTEPASTNSFSSTYNMLQFNNSNLTGLTPTAITNAPRYYYGVYYNTYSAIADSVEGSAFIGSTNTTIEATGDICPKGWYIAKMSEFGNLLQPFMDSYASMKGLLRIPYNGIGSGYISNSVISRDRTGYIHSSSLIGNSGSISYARNYYIKTKKTSTTSESFIYSVSNYGASGRAIRCVAGQTYSLVYDGNGAEGTMPNSSIVQYSKLIAGDIVKTTSPNYKYDDHSFLGWSWNKNATSAETGAEGDITVTSQAISWADANNNLTLYAIWKEKESDVTMQTFDPEDYKNEEVGFTLALRDERDDNVYTVAKLADGKFWMTDNLRLNFASAGLDENNKYIVGALNSKDGTTVTALNNNNTNNPSETFLKQTTEPASTNSFSSTSDILQFNTSNLSNLSMATTTNPPLYQFGAYYNWYTATAGVLPMTAYSDTSSNLVATGDICPKGWRLPLYYDSNQTLVDEFMTLKGILSGEDTSVDAAFAQLQALPTNLTKAGRIYYSTRDSSGAPYWTSSSRKEYAYYLRYDSYYSILYTSTINKAGTGYPIRCIAKE